MLPSPLPIYAKPVRFASSRYGDDDKLDERRPIPDRKNGFLYYFWPGRSSE
jgi:hypothetical protein